MVYTVPGSTNQSDKVGIIICSIGMLSLRHMLKGLVESLNPRKLGGKEPQKEKNGTTEERFEDI